MCASIYRTATSSATLGIERLTALGHVLRTPHVQMTGQLERGELAQVIPGRVARREIIHAVFASRRGQLPAMGLLIDFLVTQFDPTVED
jgi:hypothetical protein